MPRKSTAAVNTIIPPIPRTLAAPLIPPTGMSKRAKAIFKELVDSVPADHFDASDLPLLRQYAAACELAERAEVALAKNGAVTDKGRPSPWIHVMEKATRTMTALSARLRTSPQARASTKRRLPSLGRGA